MKTFWFLELFRPSTPSKPSLSKSTPGNLDKSWNAEDNASFYQVQMAWLEHAKEPNKQGKKLKNCTRVKPKPLLQVPTLIPLLHSPPNNPTTALPPIKVKLIYNKAGDGVSKAEILLSITKS